MGTYEADFRYFPGFGIEAIRTDQPPFWVRSPESWVAKILPYVSNNTNILACPAYQLLPPYVGNSEANPIFLANYGYNAGGSCAGTDFSHHFGLGHGNLMVDGQVLNGDFIGLSGVKAPDDMISLGDLQLPPQLAHSVITPWHKVPVGAFNSVIPSRHTGGASMIFVDSHVEWSKQPRWVVETDQARARWNNDHQPHSETW